MIFPSELLGLPIGCSVDSNSFDGGKSWKETNDNFQNYGAKDHCIYMVCDLRYQLFVLIFRLDLRMEPIEMEVNLDWHTCFHGENLGDCHRNEVNNFCRYWHFIPTERREELLDKYKEIIGEKAPDTDIIHEFKNIKFEMEKILGLRLKR